MFYHLKGTVAELEPNLAVIDCGGVGYAVNITHNTASELSLGAGTKLFISEVIREDCFELYGFYTKGEKHCFELLNAVSGIGPKAALSILSANTPESLALAIMNNNEKALTVAQGIGKKTAQRVILELKDKLGKMADVSAPELPPAVSMPSGNSGLSDAVAGLSVLGYTNADIAPVLKKLDTDGMTAEQIIRAVLKQMVR